MVMRTRKRVVHEKRDEMGFGARHGVGPLNGVSSIATSSSAGVTGFLGLSYEMMMICFSRLYEKVLKSAPEGLEISPAMRDESVGV